MEFIAGIKQIINLESLRLNGVLIRTTYRQKIFEKHQSGTGEDRALIAKYCIQDCELCINLSLSLEIITNGVSMANVCYVPLSYIYLRGQGAKVFSIVAKECEVLRAKSLL